MVILVQVVSGQLVINMDSIQRFINTLVRVAQHTHTVVGQVVAAAALITAPTKQVPAHMVRFVYLGAKILSFQILRIEMEIIV